MVLIILQCEVNDLIDKLEVILLFSECKFFKHNSTVRIFHETAALRISQVQHQDRGDTCSKF